MIVVRITGGLRAYAAEAGEIRLDATATTVGAALELLWTKAPALKDRVLTETGQVRRHINVFVGPDPIHPRDGFAAALPEGAEIFLAPAVSGG